MSQTPKTLVEWYRPDIRREVWRIWRRAFAVVVVAMLAFGIPMGGFQRPTSWTVISWIVGGVCILAGPTYLILALQRILRREVFIAVRQEGLWWQPAEGPSREASWQDIEVIMVSEGRLVVRLSEPVEPTDPTEWVFEHAFNGITTEALCHRLQELQKRALLGLRLSASR